jgi:ankyrin repeat protein
LCCYQFREFGKFYEVFEDESLLVKEQLIKSLKACAGRENESTSAAATAAYHLSMCHVNAFGTPKDLSRAWQWMMKSAQLQNPIARSQAFRLHRALFPDQHLPPETTLQMVEWLQEAVLRGSSEAAQDLRELDPSLHAKVIRSWEKRYCEINLDGISELSSPEDVTRLRQRLSRAGLNNEVLNDRGSTPVHIAASLGDIDWTAELLEHGIDINLRNSKGETPLFCACRANEPQAALYLLEKGASALPAASGESPLHWLIALDGAYLRDIAPKLIDRGAELEQTYEEIESNGLEFDIYPLGTPLDWAVSKRCLPAVEILIELGGDPFNEITQYSAFTRAISAHDWDTVEILLTSKHATPSRVCALESTGQSLLFEAVHCYLPYERLLRHGQGIDQAAVKTIKLLVEAGCDPSRVDKHGSSVMHILAGLCEYDFINLILDEFDFGKLINGSAGDLHRTPIHQALAGGKPEVVKLLIEHGANTYVQVRGRTLLHFLATNEDEDFSILCLNALDPGSRSDLDALAPSEGFSDGLTAFELAVFSTHLKVADLLLKAGADPAAGKTRERHFVAFLITLPSWDSLSALQYYLDKVETPFILRQSTSLSVLHAAASMMQFLADSFTGEQKFDVLLNRYSSNLQVNARTTSSDEPDVVAGQTPLHYAAKFGVYYAVKMLLKAGADPSLRDNNGETPVDLARKLFARLAEGITEHEMLRTVSDLKNTVVLLEKPQDMSNTTASEAAITVTDLRTRFSWLGFRTQPSGQEL